jgi:hypothetical protein
VLITRAPASRARCTAIDPTPPAAPWIRTVWPVVRRAWSISPCHAVSPEIGRAAATGVADIGRERSEVAGLRRGVLGQGAVAGPAGQYEHPLAGGQASGSASQFGDDARESCSGTLGVRSRPARSAHVAGQSSSPGVTPPRHGPAR